MNGIHDLLRGTIVRIGMAGGVLAGIAVTAQTVQHLDITQPGGMPGMPVITSIKAASNQVTVTWSGFLGPFTVEGNPTLSPGQWQLLTSGYGNSATLPMGASSVLRLSGPAPEYAGAAACSACHTNQHATWMGTAHAGALGTLQRIGMGNNKGCLPCHTVGYGMPTGYTNETMKALLGGVQCENCHGPAGMHASNPFDPYVKPVKEVAATLCGGCHTDTHHPTYDEWKTTGHAAVVEDMNPSSRINSCGRCHSGTARLAMLQGEDPAKTVAGDANVGIVCVTCHDPHQKTANAHQLRNPMASTNDFSLSTSDVFTNKYNASINLCAQCHNHRGASWSSSSRPPHHSPQYNMLIGTVGVLASGAAPNRPAGHVAITNQCAGCHMQTAPLSAGPPEIPANTGHTFAITASSYKGCQECHPLPEMLTEFAQTVVSNQLQQVKTALDLWATTKAPGALTKYQARAWEYTTPGTLSILPAGTTNVAPSSAEQALIPDNIKKARFNLYIVFHDGSYGVHNGRFATTLLTDAMTMIQQEMKK